MIAANEIRVGNRFIRELRTQRGTEYEHDFVLTEEWMGKLFGDNISIALQDLHPIPLSPEILEKCGFVYRNEHRGVGCIMDLGNIASVGILENGFRYLLLWQAPLKYLHQLQNIYFAHFGEELTYKQ